LTQRRALCRFAAPGERSKAERANEILDARDVALSAQVVQEFYTQATRDNRQDRLTHEQAAGVIQTLGLFPTQDTTVALVLASIETKQRFGISYWDAAIIEAARGLDCTVVLSEDLSDGRDYAGVMVENPFRDL
jgi:predicted nucleic acid-binding protein